MLGGLDALTSNDGEIFIYIYYICICRYTDWEISHEFDSPRPSEKEIWTKANLGEVVPGAMTPLTRS